MAADRAVSSSTLSSLLQGRCFCERIRYTLSAGAHVSSASYCHCRTCRATTGATAIAWATVPVTAWSLEGPAACYASSERARRIFCPACGSQVAFRLHDADTIDITLATLDEPRSIAPMRHIFVACRAAWTRISDALPVNLGGENDVYVDVASVSSSTAPTTWPATVTGGCHCKRVRYSIAGDIALPRAAYCHCIMCQRTCAAPAVAWASVPLRLWTLTGDPTALQSSAHVTRYFCGTCGAHIAFQRAGADEVAFTIASLDDDSLAPHPSSHIHVASKIDWHTVDDGLPVHL